MTRKQTERLFAQWQARLGLHEWRLRFVHDLTPADYDVEGIEEMPEVRVQTHTHYRWANLLIAEHWRRGSTVEEAEPTVIHELLHLALRPLTAVAEVCAPSHEDTATLYEWQVTNAEEVIVDRLSYALADAWADRAA